MGVGCFTPREMVTWNTGGFHGLGLRYLDSLSGHHCLSTDTILLVEADMVTVETTDMESMWEVDRGALHPLIMNTKSKQNACLSLCDPFNRSHISLVASVFLVGWYHSLSHGGGDTGALRGWSQGKRMPRVNKRTKDLQLQTEWETLEHSGLNRCLHQTSP